MLSGLLLNVALYALLRFKMLLAVNPAAIAPGPLMVDDGPGLAAVFAAFMLYRRRDIKRMFAYSSIEHMGIIVFAFGMGGPLANFAGLLHMTMHSPDQVGDLLRGRPHRAGQGHAANRRHGRPDGDAPGARLGVGRSACVAIAGLPPLGIFMSEFLVVSSTFARRRCLWSFWWSPFWSALGGLFLQAQRRHCLRRAERPRPQPARRPPTCRCSRISPSSSSGGGHLACRRGSGAPASRRVVGAARDDQATAPPGNASRARWRGGHRPARCRERDAARIVGRLIRTS